MFKKYSQSLNLNYQQSDNSFKGATSEVERELIKIAQKYKKLIPKPDDFLIAQAIMMHAAEASLIDQETGEPIKNARGESVSGKFISISDHKGKTSVRWESSDGIKPYKNNNGDIFPEEDLLKAYKEWVGKPLCKDHVSNSVDGIRGIIIDTYYDPKYKRVHALFALDRKNYGELARKIEAGYATSVSMGTAVGRSICTECANVATIEPEYCIHVKNRTAFGEVNKDLSPIELSIVVTGADPNAKIKAVLAHLKQYEEKVSSLVQNDQMDSKQYNEVLHTLNDIKSDVNNKIAKETNDINTEASILLDMLSNLNHTDALYDEARLIVKSFIDKNKDNLSSISDDNLKSLSGTFKHLGFNEEKEKLMPILFEKAKNLILGPNVQVGLNESNIPLVDGNGNSLRSEVDLMEQSVFKGGPGDPFTGSAPQNFASLNTNSIKTTNDATNLYEIERKLIGLAHTLENIQNEFKDRKELHKENIMTFADLKKRALERKSYFQGTEDPSKVLPYPRMGDDNVIREKEDKQMVGDELDTKADNPDQAKKELIQRAELEARMAKRAKILQKIKNADSVVKDETGKPVAVRTNDGKIKAIEQAALDKASKKKDDDKEAKEKAKAKEKAEKAKADEKAAKEKAKEKAEKAKAKEKALTKKKAYFQGTEDPKSVPYPLMGDQDGIRDREDRHMLQTGNTGGVSGLFPGDEALKKGLQRLANKKLSASFYKSAKPNDSRWDFYAVDPKTSAKEKVLSVTANQVYPDMLNHVVAGDTTLGDFFQSKQYGARVLKLIRAEGPAGAAQEMGVAPAPAPMDMPAPAQDPGALPDELGNSGELLELKEALNAGIEKLEVALEELKSAVAEEEGVADLNVSMENETAQEPLMPLASATEKDMIEAYALLNDMANELSYIYVKASEEGSDNFAGVANSALIDAELACKECTDLVKAYRVVKVKRANEMAKMDEMLALDKEELDEVKELAEEVSEESAEEALEDHEEDMHAEDGMDAGDGKDDDCATVVVDVKTSPDVDLVLNVEEDVSVKDLTADASLDKKLAMRKAHRQALIAQAGEYDDVYEAARKGGGPTLEGIKDAKDGAKVETLDETHKAMVDIATKDASGPKVREAAAALDKAIKTGSLKANQLDRLVAAGAVDPAAVAYWKQYFGQVDGGKEFADGLVKEFAKSASDNSEEKIVRYKRAFMLGQDAQERKMIGPTKAHLNEFVENMVNVPDNQFDAYKRIVAQTKAPQKGALPQVRGNSDEFIVNASLNDSQAPTVENLAKAFLEKMSIK